MSENQNEAADKADADRRKFLATCGRFAIVTPPAITILLSTSLNSTAVAHSNGQGNGWGDGGGGGDGGRGPGDGGRGGRGWF